MHLNFAQEAIIACGFFVQKPKKCRFFLDPSARFSHWLKLKSGGSFFGALKINRVVSVFEAGADATRQISVRFRTNKQTSKQDQAFWDLRFSTRKPPVPGGKKSVENYEIGFFGRIF